MANREHLAKLLGSVEAGNDWRKANSEIVPYLSGAGLRDVNLCWTDLSGAELDGRDSRIFHSRFQ